MLREIKEAAKEESTMIRRNFVHPHAYGTNILRECHGDIALSDPIPDCFSVQQDPHVHLWAVLMSDPALTMREMDTLAQVGISGEEESEVRRMVQRSHHSPSSLR